MASTTKAELDDKLDRFQFMIDSIKDHAMFVLDLDGHIINWNSGAERFTGYSELEILGRNHLLFYSAEDNEHGIPAQLLATARTQGRSESAHWHVRKDGSALMANIILTPLVQDRQTRGFVQVTRDLSERMKIDEELLAAREAIRHAQEAEVLGQLTCGVAHDFNALMISLRTGIAHLAETGSAKARQGHIRAVIDTIDQASALAAQLLTFARHQPLRPEPFDIIERLLAMRPMLETTLGERIALKMQLTPDLVRADTDRHQFETAIYNLVINARAAIQRTRGFGNVTITAAMRASLIEIVIADDGPGIAEDIRPSIFEPFFTTNETTKAHGLGLAQARGFARAAGGDLELANRQGEGATFTLTLPRMQQKVVTPLIVRNVTNDTQGARFDGSILLVEDNERIAEVAQELLEDIGLACRWARDAEMAMAMLGATDAAYDLVLTDVVMPGMSGIALARAITARWPDIPVILTSGYSDDLTTGHGGDFDMIQKPYHRTVLVNALQRHLMASQPSSA